MHRAHYVTGAFQKHCLFAADDDDDDDDNEIHCSIARYPFSAVFLLV